LPQGPIPKNDFGITALDSTHEPLIFGDESDSRKLVVSLNLSIKDLTNFLGEAHPRTLSAKHNLAETLLEQGRFHDAAVYFEKVGGYRTMRRIEIQFSN
jgi:hypothetical protein